MNSIISQSFITWTSPSFGIKPKPLKVTTFLLWWNFNYSNAKLCTEQNWLSSIVKEKFALGTKPTRNARLKKTFVGLHSMFFIWYFLLKNFFTWEFFSPAYFFTWEICQTLLCRFLHLHSGHTVWTLSCLSKIQYGNMQYGKPWKIWK